MSSKLVKRDVLTTLQDGCGSWLPYSQIVSLWRRRFPKEASTARKIKPFRVPCARRAGLLRHNNYQAPNPHYRQTGNASTPSELTQALHYGEWTVCPNGRLYGSAFGLSSARRLVAKVSPFLERKTVCQSHETTRTESPRSCRFVNHSSAPGPRCESALAYGAP